MQPDKLTLVKPLQSLKAESPIEVRLAGKLTLVKPLHPIKALSPIEVITLFLILAGMTKFFGSSSFGQL